MTPAVRWFRRAARTDRTARRGRDTVPEVAGSTGRRIASCVVAGIAAVAFAGCAGTASDPGPSTPASLEFWTNPSSEAAKQVSAWRAAGREDDARQLEKIARQPVATWPSGDVTKVESQTRSVVSQARAAGRTPVLTVYNVPDRDCGQYSGGGAADEGAYRTWLSKFAAGMSGGGARPVIVLEPDALAQTLTSCDGKADIGGREALLAGAVSTLTKAGGDVYIDAGNPGFVDDVGKLADGLRKSGIGQAAGFALNVSNFQTDDAVVAYGKKVSAAVGGARFVVDTSRNGNGPYTGPEQPTWCNPPGRALGTPPTRSTGDPTVAAFLWVKEPGDSDGSCRGAPKAGQFWPDYALGLAKNTPGT